MAELLPDVLTLPEGEGVALGEPEEEPLSEGEADSVVVAVTLGVFVPARLPSAASKPVPVLDCVRERVADPVRLAVPVDEPDLVLVARDETETVPELVGEGVTLSLSEGALERVAPVRVEVPERETDADAVEETESEAVALAEPVSDSEPDEVAEKLAELVSDGEPDGVVERLTEIDWVSVAEVVADLDTEREGVAVRVPTGDCVMRRGVALDDLLGKAVLELRPERVPVLLGAFVLVDICRRGGAGGGAGRGGAGRVEGRAGGRARGGWGSAARACACEPRMGVSTHGRPGRGERAGDGARARARGPRRLGRQRRLARGGRRLGRPRGGARLPRGVGGARHNVVACKLARRGATAIAAADAVAAALAVALGHAGGALEGRRQPRGGRRA